MFVGDDGSGVGNPGPSRHSRIAVPGSLRRHKGSASSYETSFRTGTLDGSGHEFSDRYGVVSVNV